MLHQLLRDKGVPPVVLLVPLVQRGYLGSDDDRGDGSDPPHVARVHAVPVHGKGVGAVLEEGDAVAVAGVLDRE